jgi:hypothetical protein
MKKTLLSLLLFIPFIGFGQNAWINEIHYDDPGTDNTEFVEIVIENPASFTLSLFKIELYNGASSSGAVYDTRTVDNFAVGSTNGTFKYYSFSFSTDGLQNGAPDGIALSYNGTLIQFLSYEGSFTGVGGAAAGIISTNIGVSETNTGTAGTSLQLIGTLSSGTMYSNLTWGGPIASTKGTANPTTLPISLTSFTGKAIDKSILLNWETASETNNDYYEILKSGNGKTFTAIGTVKGSGTTKDAKNYSLVDNNPAAGTNYYQLVQYDFDGKSSKSDVIPVNSSIANSSLTVYAAASSVNVSINSANATDGTLQIFDITGKKLNETKLSLSKGFNTLSIPLSLNSGIHVINFITSAEVINSKFIKD